MGNSVQHISEAITVNFSAVTLRDAQRAGHCFPVFSKGKQRGWS